MINSDKMKVMLTREDMTHYDIRMYSLGHTGNAIREAFSKVLDDIRDRTGFETVPGKTILQVYPARDGGCEVFITKLGAGGDDSVRSDSYINDSNTKVTLKKWLEKVIFAFESITDAIDACRMLKRDGYSYKSSLYEKNGVYYLFLESEPIGSELMGELCKLSDYGRRIGGRITESYIYEHCEPVIEKNAVEALSAESFNN